MNGDKAILGEYINQGFSLEESDGHYDLYLKDTKIKELPLGTTESEIRDVVEQFLKLDREIEGLLHKATAECGLGDAEHRELNRLIAEQEAHR